MDLLDEYDPLTGERYVRPVIASDGQTYELDNLIEMMSLLEKKESPFTREILRPTVLFHFALADKMNLPYPDEGAFVIYEGAPVAFDSICAETIIGCTLSICMLKCVTCEWLALLFDAMGLLSKKVRLEVVLEAS